MTNPPEDSRVNIAEGPWVWCPWNPYKQRVVIVKETRFDQYAVLNEVDSFPRQEHRFYAKQCFDGPFALNKATKEFIDRVESTIDYITNEIPTNKWIQEYVASRPKTIEEFIALPNVEEFIDEYLDDDCVLFCVNKKHWKVNASSSLKDKVEQIIEHQLDELWDLFDHYTERNNS